MRRWHRKPAHVCPTYREPWQVAKLAEAEALLMEVWFLHGTPYPRPDRPGFGPVMREWYCSNCSQPWPCSTARKVINWGQVNDYNYEPLSLAQRLPETKEPTP